MKIECLEDFQHEGQYKAGEIRQVSDELGAYFCGLGWAKDTEGKVATGERNTGEVTLAPSGQVQAQSGGTPG